MQNVLFGALAVAALVIAVAVAVLVSGLLRELKKVGRTCEDLSQFLNTTEQEIASTTEVVRQTVTDLDGVVAGVSRTVEKVECVVTGVEEIVQRVQAASSVAKALGLASRKCLRMCSL